MGDPILVAAKRPPCWTCPDKGPAPTVEATTPVRTPYYRTFGPEPIPNYRPYDLFAFRTKIRAALYLISPSWEPALTSYSDGEAMRLTVTPQEGGVAVASIDPATAAKIQAAVDHAAAFEPEHCLLFSSNTPFGLPSAHPDLPCPLPPAWVSAALPYIPVHADLRPFIDKGCLYVSLNPAGPYDEEYTSLFRGVSDALCAMYRAGAVVCDPDLDAGIIGAWELRPYIVGGSGPRPHAPSWRDRRFAPDPAAFVRERLGGTGWVRISLSGRGGNIQRHAVARALDAMGVAGVFVNLYVEVPCASHSSALALADIVDAARYSAVGEIAALYPAEGPEAAEAARQALGGGDIVAYRCADADWRPWVVSIVVPLGEDGDDIREDLAAAGLGAT